MPKAPLCPIWVYASLELVHLDYTSIESTVELNKLPVVKNVLVMMDHFTRYVLVVVTKDQTATTIMKVFYEHLIAVFGAPTKLLINSHICPGGGTLCCLWYPGVQNHSLPCSVQLAGGTLPPDTVLYDWQAGM